MSNNTHWSAEDLNKKGLIMVNGKYVPASSQVAKGKVSKIEPSINSFRIPITNREWQNTIIEKYHELKNIWHVGEAMGISGQMVHKILVDNNIKLRNPRLSATDIQQIRTLYETGFECGDGQLDTLCNQLNRTKQFICRKAKELGFTSRERSQSDIVKNRMSVDSTLRIKENGHPKGMLGKTHTEENRLIMGARSKEMWANPESVVNSDEYRQHLSDRVSNYMTNKTNEQSTNDYSRVKHGTITIGDRSLFVRSSWEANIAAYLEFQRAQGIIIGWEYESDTFWFEAIKRGVRSYKPDFKITNLDGSIYFIEVKGWMDDKSKTKLKRMKKYYPKVKIELIDEVRYKNICRSKSVIPFWGQLDGKTKGNNCKI